MHNLYMVIGGVSFGELEGKIWMEWQKLHLIACVIEENASWTKHITQKSLLGKETLCNMGMKYQKIHAYPNDCILYKNEFNEMRKCLTCGVSRYIVKDDACSDNPTTNNNFPAKVW